ncbi:triphosphoribosyl-dephospho-CoA synthase [Saliphagus infecundisoli]|uniref:Triphosphoribosyl-dephospho-CoA synthase n=1 Tax=Saliphagus infecundisoli TaxID=1849069 RepID=A0ABD5QF89_9EURY|nr:triphosphoribosyl-dephospho-CoA synthase [Saliphagus infecundisoli]
MTRSPAETAQLALLLEVSATPKPGNVDRERDLSGLRYDHFLAGAVGSREGLELAGEGAPVGSAFERAVAGMGCQEGGNTQFGSLLLLVPLVRAASGREVTPAGVREVVEGTTVEDAAGFYRAFDHTDVRVGEPPEGMEPLDVRRGSEAVPAVEERGLTLLEVMAASVPGDDVAREWTEGFERSFRAAGVIGGTEGTPSERAAAAFLSALADRPDTLVATKHGERVAEEVRERAAELDERSALDTEPEAVEAFADDLVSRGVNPGTTADLVCAGLFVALERGELVV